MCLTAHPAEELLYNYIFTILQFHRYLVVKNGDMDKLMILTNNAIGAFTNPVQFLKFRHKATPAQLGWEEERKKSYDKVIHKKKSEQLQD
jgi:hypothetical protein